VARVVKSDNTDDARQGDEVTVELMGAGISRGAMRADLRELAQHLGAAAEERHAAAARAPRQLRTRWPDLTRRTQRTLIRTPTTVIWIEPVEPGKRYSPLDPNRVQIVWRA
jgi:hypothetical protein